MSDMNTSCHVHIQLEGLNALFALVKSHTSSHSLIYAICRLLDDYSKEVVAYEL